MAVPAFDFTTRAKPVVQFGRSVHRLLGNDKWGRAQWGVGRWGARDWEPVWTDITCEVHEITTDTGRGGATERFRPGTAEIVASNVTGLSELIFPPVPAAPYEIEFVPQPPIAAEETLQAPNATTIISNGWSFTDDFEQAPPRWIFPAAFADTGTFPTRPMVWGTGYIAPEMYGDAASFAAPAAFEAHGVAQWTRNYPDTENLSTGLVIPDLAWPHTPDTGTPQLVVDLCYGMGTVDRSCNVARFTFTPNFAGPNDVDVAILRRDVDGTVASGSSSPGLSTTIGTNGDFGTVRLSAVFARASSESGIPGGTIRATVNGHDHGYLVDAWTPGRRIGFVVDYAQGDLGDDDRPDAPHITEFLGPDFDDDFLRPLGSGWTQVPRYRGLAPMLQEGGAMRAPVRYFGGADGVAANGVYYADGTAQWVSDFDGDQVIEIEATGMSTVEVYNISEFTVELYCRGNRQDLSAVVALIYYLPGAPTGRIDWVIARYGPGGESEWFADGSIDIATWGDFPEPAVWRLEADTLGEARLFYQGALLGSAMFEDPPDGHRIGLKYHWGSGGPVDLDTLRPSAPRIERVTGGLREPLGAEELGTWIRIGVDHATLGVHWMFRGFVDAVVPTYVPDRDDAVRIECIDSLGEAGRVFVDGAQLSYRFQGAPHRIRQILDAAHWPAKLRAVHDDSTIISRPEASKAVDLLTHVAESCGGAVFGDPDTGNIVFKGQDWQGAIAAGPAEAYITNLDPPVDVPIVCPTGWERSTRRSDMTTRVRFSTESSDTDDFHPLLFEWRHPEAEHLYGVELYERTLLCITRERVQELARRQLVLRNPNQFPRIEAVLLDASTADEALDLMTTATFTRPSKYRCQLHRPDQGVVFNRGMLVTGVRHRMTPAQWTTRLALDPASVFAEVGARWGRAHWGRDVWGRTR